MGRVTEIAKAIEDFLQRLDQRPHQGIEFHANWVRKGAIYVNWVEVLESCAKFQDAQKNRRGNFESH